MIGLKPKFHYMCHMIYELDRTGATANPWAGCTWRDEDFVGKIMRMVKAVHSRSVGVRVIEHYLARLNGLL